MNCLPSLRVIPAFTRWCYSRFLTRDTHTKVDATAYWKLPWLSLTSAQLAQFLDWVNSKARKRIHFGGLKMSSLCFSPSVLWGTRRKGQVGAVGECRQYICWCCLLTTTARNVIVYLVLSVTNIDPHFTDPQGTLKLLWQHQFCFLV